MINPRRASIPLVAVALGLLPAMASAVPVPLDTGTIALTDVSKAARTWWTEGSFPGMTAAEFDAAIAEHLEQKHLSEGHDPLTCPVGSLLHDLLQRVTDSHLPDPSGPVILGQGPSAPGIPSGGGGHSPSGSGPGGFPFPTSHDQSPQQVPEPAAMFLVGSGLLALGLWRRGKEE